MQWDSEQWREVRNKKFLEWFLGNTAAVEFMINLSTIVETWDDLIDQDKQILPQDIHFAFAEALVGLPRNAFYYQYRPMIEPLIIMAVNAYLDSEIFAKRTEAKWRMQSFWLRNFGGEILQMIAYCVGGFTHMRKVSIEIREFLSHESYDEWEHRHVD